MKYSIIRPGIPLQSHVQYFWTLEVYPDSCNFPIRTFVDDSTGMLLEFSADGKGGSPRRSMIYGQTTSPTFNPNKNPFFVLGVLFQPYAIKELFHVDAHELTNQRINLNDFFEPQFMDRIASNHNLLDKVNALSTQISTNFTAIKYADEVIKHCIFYIKKHNGMLTVKDLQVKFGISERQLERRFKDVVGVSPRHYLKITKFRHAVPLKRFYIETLDDKALTIKSQRRMQTMLPCEKVYTLETGHSPFLSQPERLATILTEISSILSKE